MGAAASIGIDIDPQAVTSARQNIASNDMDSSKMLVYLVPSETDSSCIDAETNMDPEERPLLNLELKSAKGKFDIIIANILLNPLLELAKDIVSYGKPGANIGLSGILSEQVPPSGPTYSMIDYLVLISRSIELSLTSLAYFLPSCTSLISSLKGLDCEASSSEDKFLFPYLKKNQLL